MSTDYTTGTIIRRAFMEAPVLRHGLRLTLFMAMAGQAITVVTPIVIQQIIDEEILAPTGIDMSGVLQKAAVALVALVIGVVVGRVALLRLVKTSSSGLSDLRSKTFGHIMRQSVLHVQAERRGTLVSRVTSDISTLQEFMEWGGIGLIVGLSQVVLATAVMVIYEWRMALIALGGVVIYLMMMRWFQRILAAKYDEVRHEVGVSLGVMSESISAIPVVRAYGTEDTTKARVASAMEKRFRVEFTTGRFGNILYSTAEIFAGILTATLIVAGVLIGIDQGMSAGTLVAFLFLTNLLIEPLQIVVETLEFAQSAASGLRRVIGVLDDEVEIEEPSDPEELRPGGLSVRFDHVGYAYPGGPDVLTDISLEVAVGSRVAVVGETGSGKTTFAKLAVRLLDPSEGAIHIGGVQAPKIPLAHLRDRVAFVPQEGFLFDDTIANNVRYGRTESDDAEIWTAFHELGLGEWVDGLTDGLETRVGERGGSLSAGERQLVAIVRAWIGSPDLLVLDEATSAVDPVLDVALRHAIARLTEGRTSVTIAHRLSTAEGADEVFVFDGGRIVERGRHRDLLKLNGTYAGLYADWASGTNSV
ncbi:MAG: ABC transporter ATP-binding protein [Acidobacteria bacterium]|nr:ABC transporter ATP-binding protein [Acidobacteriota bacterium]TDI52061.1 MAG: ABC transporter ATP-binding protein [Acidobacteriota bacterium]